MEIVERYIQAVRFWLPGAQAHDIAAELSEDIRSQIEEKQSSLGRQLTETEIADLLKLHGRPVLVANRFRPQQYLIGPVLFPIYSFVLKIVAAFFMVPWVVAWIGIHISRAAHSGESLIGAVASFWTSFWPMAFFMIGSVTTVFAVLERVEAKSHFMDQWDPRKLPPVRDRNRIPLINSIIEVVANFVFCSWLIAGAWYQTTLRFSAVSITLAPIWKYFFWGFAFLAVANTFASSVNLFRPYWTWQRAAVRMVSDCAGAVLFCLLMKANILLGITVANVPAAETAQIAQAINWWSAKMFPVAIVACLAIAAGDAYRIYRVRSKAAQAIVLNAATRLC